MDDLDRLTDRQRMYVQHLAAGMPSRAAARSAGYSDSFTKVAAFRLGKKPTVVAAIARIREEGMKMACYDLAAAMAEADEAARFARLHKNSMANVKACELRAKLSWLLIDRLELVPPVDLKGSLLAAQTRVLNAIDITFRQPSAELGQVADAAYYYGPGIKGNPFGD